MINKVIILIITLSSALTAQAQGWKKINIPNAVCGNGEPYSIFMDEGNAEQLVIEFMGGGACWSDSTCHGSQPLTSLVPLKGEPAVSVFTENVTESPWKSATKVYLPYCTGDVYSANHETQYRKSVKVYHRGYANTLQVFKFLKEKDLLRWQEVKDITLGGSSAGAIGALVHAKTLDQYLSADTRRTLISDSPGLHFGSTFWQKFPAPMKNDFAKSFASIGLDVDFNDGLLAPKMGPVFTGYAQWKIGILQSTKDMVMSLVFGNIVPDSHRRLVLGRDGIQEIAKDYDNVSTWIADLTQHTFLSKPQNSLMKDMKGETAKSFVYREYLD